MESNSYSSNYIRSPIMCGKGFCYCKSRQEIGKCKLRTNPLEKAELALLFSDKRLIASQSMFEIKKPDIGLSTLSKGEKYLEIATNEEMVARSKGYDTSEFLKKLSLSSLKHRQIIEESIISIAPEDAKPDIVKIEDYAKNSYKSARDGLNNKGMPTPIDPFDGQ